MVDFKITENEAGQRLDRFLRKYMKRAPLSMIYKTIRKDVKVNGKRAHEDTILQEGDQLSLYIPEEKLNDLTRQQTHRRVKRQFRIAYEDENLLIVEKPSGLLTHGDSREKKNTLANQVCGYLQEKGEFIKGEVFRTFAGEPSGSKHDRSGNFRKECGNPPELYALYPGKAVCQQVLCDAGQRKFKRETGAPG